MKTTNNGQFVKGQNPWNSGRTDLRLSPKSEFKKGHLPHNTKSDGTITIRNDRSSKTGILCRYKYIRISLGKWTLYQRYVYEQHHGVIPKGCIIAFKDGDSMNCTIDNLECITRAENAHRNRNLKKTLATYQSMIEEGDHPSSSLTDKYIAGLLGRGSDELKAMVAEYPNLLETKRLTILLKRQFKKDANEQCKRVT
jgi:hypothetical protein